MDFTFGVCTDLHFGPPTLYKGRLRKLSAHAGELLAEALHAMNARAKPELVVNLGDDIEDESREADVRRYRECMDVLARSGCDLLHVAGNHDTVNLDDAHLRSEWDRTAGWAKGAWAATGKLHYSVDRGGIHFVVLHTREVQDKNVSIDEAQLAWFERDLAATVLPTIVLMHHSAADQHLVGNPWFEGRAHVCLVQERKTLRRIIEEREAAHPGSVLAVLNGHVHWNHLDVIRGIPYVTFQSLIENLDDDAPGRPAKAFAVVQVTRSRLVIEVGGAERARYQFDRR